MQEKAFNAKLIDSVYRKDANYYPIILMILMKNILMILMIMIKTFQQKRF